MPPFLVRILPLVCLSLAACVFSVGPPPSARPAPAASIAAGQTVRGRLEPGDPLAADDSHYDEYVLSGRAGERLVVTLASAEFDAFLAWGRGTGAAWEQLGGDDDSGGGTDSRLVLVLPRDGEYALRANALRPGETGAYTLTVQPAP